MSDPKGVVEAGYDRIAEHYLAWCEEIEGDPRTRFLDEVIARLPARRRTVLDLGCGAGVPSTAALAEHADVIGVDLSGSQIELARTNVPNARFLKADMTAVEFPPESLDAVTAFYSVLHVPRDEQAALFNRIAGWLRPNGCLLVTLPAADSDETVDDWLGTPMYFSGHDTETNRRLLTDAGFDITVDEIVTIREPEGDATFQWVIATKQ